MPLEFWVGVAEGEFLQLDDVVVVETPLPDGETVRLFGVVDLVRARHEGAKFDSDVFLIEKGVLPAEVSQAAHVRVTRVEPEVFVPPLPGPARSARRRACEREQALFFDAMERRLPIGLSRDGEPVFANLDFLDGTRGAHVNISGISGVATKTSYATFLLQSLFTQRRARRRGGEHARASSSTSRARTCSSSTSRNDAPQARRTARATASSGFPRGRSTASRSSLPSVRARGSACPTRAAAIEGVSAFFWTLRELVAERLLRFLFAETDARGEPARVRRGPDRGQARGRPPRR